MPSWSIHTWRRISLALIASGVLLAATAVMRKSVTADEYQALPSGLAILGTGDFHYPEGTPPLSQLLPALPSYLRGARVPAVEGRNANWAVAQAFAAEHGSDYHVEFLLARSVSLLFLAATLLFTCLLAQRLYGAAGAALAAGCAALNPTLLAHGALVTPDIYLAAAFTAFLLWLDRHAERRTPLSAAAGGAIIGLACLSKFTGLLLFPLLPLLLLLSGLSTGKAKDTAIAWAAALFVIHAGYFFHGLLPLAGGLKLGTPLPPWLALPFPADFARALDGQLHESPYLAYLLGDLNFNGFFSYYVVALLVKTPAGILVLAALATAMGGKASRRERPLLFLIVFFFTFYSLARYKNLGVRYLLFLYPWLAVWIARLVPALAGTKRRFARPVAALSAISVAAGAFLAWPDYIAYFNLASGGPREGHRYLLDSNLDWGQDLTTLKDFMLDHGIETVSLAYFGRLDPRVYGIRYTTLNGLPASRYVAISANFLWGRTYFVNGTLFYPESTKAYTPYRSVVPLAVLGHSIYVYDTDTIPQLKGLVPRD